MRREGQKADPREERPETQTAQAGLDRWLPLWGTVGKLPMVTVHVTQHLRREGFEGPWRVDPGSLRQVLDALFRSEPRLRSYLVDDQGRIRKHVAVFLDGQALTDREEQRFPVPGGSELHLLQALSGG